MPSRSKRGFILATTLLVMTLMTVMLAAAFVMISAEFRTTNGSYGSTRALNMAQAGLQSYLAASHNLSTGYDSTNYTFTGGYARVVARRLRDSTSTIKSLWAVYATGIDTTQTTNRGSSGAQRVTAVLATLSTSTLPHRAAMIAVNGVTLNGTGTSANPFSGTTLRSGAVTGCSDPGGAAYDTIALATGAHSWHFNGPSGGANYWPTGEGTNGMATYADSSAMLDSTHVDWAKLINGQFTPDYIGVFPPLCSGVCAYSTYYWTTDVTIPTGQRRGFLVTTGNVTLATGAHWDGIILAGGNINSPNSAAYTIHGFAITGMKLALGDTTVQPNQFFRGGTVQWDYCYATASIGSLASLTVVAGTQTDSWKTY